ncbi:TM2 domain-containing protein [Borreliella bissettiae]|uniref:TM2 domain protein n=1 Tax=Borrelia bissettiae (strain DSM 17990 / CIP 109136 / DN127) TaxID=521010 RepID=G0ANL4_BORBD|nr:TM2 domain-containing protein [Borreliella bissettiae]AEL19290.1 TM2 domain protein [Borreliella bissettiae DN127]
MSKAVDEIYCHSCGKTIKKDAEICISCGVKNKQVKKSYNKLIAALLCLFFGYLGAHRFYVGKMGTGITFLCIILLSPFFYLFTLGFGLIIILPVLAILEIIVFIDFIRILINKF